MSRHLCPTRREFLQRSTAMLAGVALSAQTIAAPAPRSRPFGFSLYGMKALPLTAAIDHVARIGYRQLELALMSGFPSEPARFSPAERRATRERIADRGLELSSLLVNLSLAGDDKTQRVHLDALQRAGEVAHDLAAEKPPVIETILGGKPAEWDANKDLFAERLRRWAEAAGSGAFTLCVKAHADQAVNTPDRLLWLHRTVDHPRLALVYDYSHFQFAGLGLEETLRAILPHTRFIHVKDVVVGQKTPRYLLVGEGTIDYAQYFRLLNELRYEGPLVVEVSAQIFNQPAYDGVKTAERCHAFLSRFTR